MAFNTATTWTKKLSLSLERTSDSLSHCLLSQKRCKNDAYDGAVFLRNEQVDAKNNSNNFLFTGMVLPQTLLLQWCILFLHSLLGEKNNPVCFLIPVLSNLGHLAFLLTPACIHLHAIAKLSWMQALKVMKQLPQFFYKTLQIHPRIGCIFLTTPFLLLTHILSAGYLYLLILFPAKYATFCLHPSLLLIAFHSVDFDPPPPV